MPMPIPGQAPGQMPGQPSLPPSMSPAPSNMGPGTMPGGNQGNSALAMIDVKNALSMLQKSLPMIPMGSPVHSDILNAVKTLSKHVGQDGGNQGLELQSLMQLIKSQTQQAPLAALSRLYPGGGPNLPPAMGAAPGPTPGGAAPGGAPAVPPMPSTPS